MSSSERLVTIIGGNCYEQSINRALGEDQEFVGQDPCDLGIFSFVVHWFGGALNGAAGSFPGGYYMAGQGSQLAFAILIFWFVNKQNKLDEEFGVAED